MNGYIQGPSFIDIPFLIVDDSTIHNPFIANPQDARVLIDMENALSVLDALGGCKFMGYWSRQMSWWSWYGMATGWDFTLAEFRKTGDRLQTLGRCFCAVKGCGATRIFYPNG